MPRGRFQIVSISTSLQWREGSSFVRFLADMNISPLTVQVLAVADTNCRTRLLPIG